jgi:hypothetical protein
VREARVRMISVSSCAIFCPEKRKKRIEKKRAPCERPNITICVTKPRHIVAVLNQIRVGQRSHILALPHPRPDRERSKCVSITFWTGWPDAVHCSVPFTVVVEDASRDRVPVL